LFLAGIHIAKGFGLCNRGKRPDTRQPAKSTAAPLKQLPKML
jgi:hypothetical protein